jgi:hypothetical protein
VEAPGIESRAPSALCVAFGGGKTRKERPAATARKTRLSASSAASGASSTADVDSAIRTAAKIAIDAGDFGRATALLDMLTPKVAIVTPLNAVRERKLYPRLRQRIAGHCHGQK